MTLIVANLSALKIWSLGGIPVDAGVIVFPLSYVAGDLLAEFYGERTADFVATIAAAFGLVTLVVINLANALPNYPGADNHGFNGVAMMAGRVFIASIISFLLGQVANNRVFEAVRKHRSDSQRVANQNDLAKITDAPFARAFAQRAIASSGIAHTVDALVFELIAFYGKLPLGEFLKQIGFAYVIGIALELCCFPVTYFLAYKGHKSERSTP